VNILIVDDNKSNRELLAFIIKKYDPSIAIDFAVDGEEGLIKILRSNYTLVFLDHDMPNKTGIQVLTELKEEKNHTPVVMVTIHESVKLTISAIKLGVLDFINKPFVKREIHGSIDKIKDLKKRNQLEVRSMLENKLRNISTLVENIGQNLTAPLVTIYSVLTKIRQNSVNDKELLDTVFEELYKISRTADLCKNYQKNVGMASQPKQKGKIAKANKSTLSFDKTNFNSILDKVIKTKEAKIKKRGVQIKKIGTLPALLCEAPQMEKIFDNLISNAIQFNINPKPKIEIGYQNDAFYIKDNGIGIEEEDFEKIFDIFVRLHKKSEFEGGTGAGLTIAKKLILKHNGKIWLESELTKGTTFFFTIGSGKKNRKMKS